MLDSKFCSNFCNVSYIDINLTSWTLSDEVSVFNILGYYNLYHSERSRQRLLCPCLSIDILRFSPIPGKMAIG